MHSLNVLMARSSGQGSTMRLYFEPEGWSAFDANGALDVNGIQGLQR